MKRHDLTLLSPFYMVLSMVMMIGAVLAEVGQDILGIVAQQLTQSSLNVTEVAIYDDDQLSDVLGSAEPGTVIFDPVSNTTYEVQSSNYTRLGKRDNYCTYTKQVQIANSGIWWSPWYKVGACVYNQYSAGDAQYSLGYSYSYSWSIEAGPIGWGQVSSIIGAQWQKTVTHEASLTCTIPAGLKGSVWYQTQVLWGNAQYRDISVCNGQKSVGAWLKYYHFNTPSRFDLGSDTVHLGCSTGQASQCP